MRLVFFLATASKIMKTTISDQTQLLSTLGLIPNEPAFIAGFTTALTGEVEPTLPTTGSPEWRKFIEGFAFAPNEEQWASLNALAEQAQGEEKAFWDDVMGTTAWFIREGKVYGHPLRLETNPDVAAQCGWQFRFREAFGRRLSNEGGTDGEEQVIVRFSNKDKRHILALQTSPRRGLVTLVSKPTLKQTHLAREVFLSGILKSRPWIS